MTDRESKGVADDDEDGSAVFVDFAKILSTRSQKWL